MSGMRKNTRELVDVPDGIRYALRTVIASHHSKIAAIRLLGVPAYEVDEVLERGSRMPAKKLERIALRLKEIA